MTDVTESGRREDGGVAQRADVPLCVSEASWVSWL